MKVKFEFTLDDMVDASQRGLARSRTVRSWRWQAAVVPSLMFGLVAYLITPGSGMWKFLWAGAAAVVCALIFPSVFGKANRERLRKAYREQFGGEGPFTCEVELTPAGLATVQAGTQATHAWSIVAAVEDRVDSIDFLMQGLGIVVVRNRAFSSSEERRRFLTLARQYVGVTHKAQAIESD